MKQLTNDEIAKYAERPGVRKIAVENFLSTLGQAGNMRNEFLNMRADAKVYRWNDATLGAIEDGIRQAYAEG